MKKLFKNKKGFTLVELMVVVAIMGILVAVAVPVYKNATEKAAIQTCSTNCRTVEGVLSQMKAVAQSEGEFTETTDLAGEFGTYAYGPTGDVQKIADFLKECPTDATYSIAADGTVTATKLLKIKDQTAVIDKNGVKKAK